MIYQNVFEKYLNVRGHIPQAKNNIRKYLIAFLIFFIDIFLSIPLALICLILYPAFGTISFSIPFLVPTNAIDPMGMLKISPTSDIGRLLYAIEGSDIYYKKEFVEKNMILLGLSRVLFTHSLPLVAAEQCYNKLLSYILVERRRGSCISNLSNYRALSPFPTKQN